MLNPYHLKYFCDACQNRSLSKSAEMNRVSHSAISQAIKSLELHLEVPLLLHARRKFQLTNAGELLFKEAAHFFIEFEKISNSIKIRPLQDGGPLKIGISSSIASGIINQYLIKFLKSHPRVEPQIFISNSAALEHLLNSLDIDIGFGIEDGSFVRFERKLIHSGKFILVSGKKCLRENHFWVGDKGAEVLALRLACKRRIPNAHFNVIQSWNLLLQMAEAELGTALIPDFLFKKQHYKNLIQTHKNINLPHYDLYAFHRSKDSLSYLAQAFLDTLP